MAIPYRPLAEVAEALRHELAREMVVPAARAKIQAFSDSFGDEPVDLPQFLASASAAGLAVLTSAIDQSAGSGATMIPNPSMPPCARPSPCVCRAPRCDPPSG